MLVNIIYLYLQYDCEYSALLRTMRAKAFVPNLVTFVTRHTKIAH